MNDHEADAFDALRRLDGPAELDDGAESRIEAEVLARFDGRLAAGPIPTDAPTPIVALEHARDRASRGRGRSIAMALGAAAAAVLVVAGILVISVGDDPGPSSPSASRPSTTTTVPAAEQSALDAQLAVFCSSYIAPLRAADDVWAPRGAPSEQRVDVLIAAEQAAQAMSELDPPLGDRLARRAEEALAAVTEARLADTLAEPDADDAVIAAVDAVFGALSSSGASRLPEVCTR